MNATRYEGALDASSARQPPGGITFHIGQVEESPFNIPLKRPFFTSTNIDVSCAII